eukprot:SAG22_NODE_5709_length_967_cov_1.175115_1_plen_68_part_00
MLANKQDLAGARLPGAVEALLGLAEDVEGGARALPIDWRVQGVSALLGDGISEGIRWLASVMEVDAP